MYNYINRKIAYSIDSVIKCAGRHTLPAPYIHHMYHPQAPEVVKNVIRVPNDLVCILLRSRIGLGLGQFKFNIQKQSLEFKDAFEDGVQEGNRQYYIISILTYSPSQACGSFRLFLCYGKLRLSLVHIV